MIGIYVSLNNNFMSSPGNMATSLGKYFRKSNKEKKVKKRPKRSFYNFLCGGINEEDRDTGEEPIAKAGKEKSEDMGIAESKSLSAGRASIIEVAGKDESREKGKIDKLEDKKKKEQEGKELGVDEVDKATPIEADEGTDIDASKEVKDKENKNENENNDECKSIEIQDKFTEKTTESVSEGVNKDEVVRETERKADAKDIGIGETKDEDDSTSSSSDSDSSNYTSCDEDKNDKTDKKRKTKSKKTEVKKSDSKKKAKTPSESETHTEKESEKTDKKIERSEEKTETPVKPKKKSGKNPLVRMQSKILDALSHQNFDSYTPAICIDFLKSPNLKLLSSLNKKLKHNIKEWNEEFLQLQGSDVLMDIVDTLGYKRVTQLSDALLLLESIECIKALMNSKMGLKYLVQHGEYLKKLVKGESCFVFIHFLLVDFFFLSLQVSQFVIQCDSG